MPRVPYVPADIAEPRDVVNLYRRRRIEQKMNNGELLNLDRTLLHSPPFAKGWMALFIAVRDELQLPAKLREIAICTVAVLTQSDYSLEKYHIGDAFKAGVTQAQVDALLALRSAPIDPKLFNDTERTVIQLATEVTRDAVVGDATFAAAAAALPDNRQIVELIGVVVAYNMLTRFLVALRVGQ